MSIKLDKNGNAICTKCTASLWNLYNKGIMPVIPDIKMKSPGEGNLLFQRDPVEYAKALETAGAPVISVVTETKHYGGSYELLEQIAHTVSVPVLHKDFITTKEQLKKSAEMGASGVLLIASILKEKQLSELVLEAHVLGLEPLVEIHNEEELQMAIRIENITFLGINNRNILVYEVDSGTVGTSEKLAGFVKKDLYVLSESSITSPEEVQRAVSSGCNGVLVGTAILKADDPVTMFSRLSIKHKIK